MQSAAIPSNTSSSWRASTWHLLLTALTVLTFLTHGYHPLAEDGGLYVAGIEWKLDPTLFPHYTAFVTEHLRFSIFAPTVAAIVRISHLPLPWCLLLIDLLSIGLTLYAGRQILRRCIASEPAQLAGVALLAAWWTLPVAATSLLLMDPYVTARSLSMPLSLLAIAFTLDDWRTRKRSLVFCAGCLLAAALFHPLMSACALSFVVLLRAFHLRRPAFALSLLTVAAVASASVLQLRAPFESPALRAAEITRYYWFLSQWHWYELFGLIAPLAIFFFLQRARTPAFQTPAVILCRACVALGLIAITIAAIFAHEHFATHVVARLQPLRVFLYLYAIMAMLLGALLFDFCSHPRPRSAAARLALRTIPTTTIIAIALIMFYVQRESFPGSQHLELPWRATSNPNPWVQAFLWARANTPRDALFAIDANYITTPGEDAQTFRAIAQRSVLPDYSKDGGEVSITPSLAPAWRIGTTAQSHLSSLSDTDRRSRLNPLGVTWMVLHSTTPTLTPCPYDNATIKVCPLNP
jgi:hypothetical protein